MTNTTKRITKKDYFNALVAYCEANEIQFSEDISADAMKDFATHEIELLSKKRSSAEGTVRKLTPEQKRNEEIKLEILAFLADGQLHTIAEMIKNVPSLIAMENVSPQRVSALLTQLGTKHGTGEVESQIIKRVTYFKRREV